uniref:Uncharacterized protein n=1 Tax=Arundo donax TaxID=35708 RepID=A0A0A9D5Y0_ARUDO
MIIYWWKCFKGLMLFVLKMLTGIAFLMTDLGRFVNA